MTLFALTSDTLDGVQHGFFTRAGGASSGIYAGLNCGPGSGDQTAVVAVNRARVAQEMGVGPEALLSVRQHHSATVVPVEGPWAERPAADAMVTDRPGLALGVLAADCAPVLLADAEAGVVGAAHAGWRGALAGITDATIAAMETLGAVRSRIRAAVGPAISQRNYEVGPDFVERFLDDDPENGQFFAGGDGDRSHFDLPRYVVSRLRDADVESAWTGHCTYADPVRFYSYRRATHRREADYGRLISVIRL